MKEISDGKIKTIVFDMDGTIHSLDGDNGGFTNSTLHKIVNQNAVHFFSQRENISIPEAEALVADIHHHGIAMSIYASQKYGISKKDYFDIVWNISPDKIVVDYHDAVEVIKELANRDIELILLTQSPQIWQSKVFHFIGLDNLFAEVYTAENYQKKGEIFPKLKNSRHPQSILAIGDQIDTDILPAQAEGYYTFHVKSPKDLLQLIQDGQ